MLTASFVLFATWLQLAIAKDVYLDWNVTWVNASPDGFERPVIGINDQWPCPQIDVDLGDRLIVDVYNGLGNQSTGIHWHGFFQYMSGVMDGTSQVTQCPLPPGKHMRYDFQVCTQYTRSIETCLRWSTIGQPNRNLLVPLS